MQNETTEQKKQCTVLCVDIGTSSLKVALIDSCGKVIASDRRRFDKNDQSTMWLSALRECTLSFFHTQKLENPQAISISGNGPTIAAMFTSGKSKILLWNEEKTSPIQKTYTGPSLFIPRLLLYKNLYAKSFAKIESFFSGPEYLVWQLTGKRTTLLPENRFLKAYWTKEDLLKMEIPQNLLPPFIELGKESGKIQSSMRDALGFTQSEKEIPVFCAGPDFTSALIGTNTLSPGTICDRAGSSEGFNMCTDTPVSEKNIRTLPSVIPPLYNASILIPDSGIRFSAVKKKTPFDQATYTEYVTHLLKNRHETGFHQMIELAHDCSKALTLLLSYSHTNAERRIVVTGGQAKNDLWLQVKSDIMNTIITVPSCTDAELSGNAAVALFGLGYSPSLITAAKNVFSVGKTFYPTGETYRK